MLDLQIFEQPNSPTRCVCAQDKAMSNIHILLNSYLHLVESLSQATMLSWEEFDLIRPRPDLIEKKDLWPLQNLIVDFCYLQKGSVHVLHE